MSKKEMTTDDLARKVDGVAKSVDNLARITKDGFDGVDKRFNHVEECLDKLETGQKDIKLRLDSAAWRFELKALEGRVIVLEKKAKFA